MRIGLKILLIFLVFSIMITVVFYSIELKRQNETNDQIISDHIAQISIMFKELESLDTKMLSSALELAIQDRGLKEAYLKNDRDFLYDKGNPLFQNLKYKFGITHFYFILPDGRVFLRLHNKAIYDDSIKRITFLKANETKELATGIELGKTAFALRAIRPYYEDGNLIGYVELGEEIDHFLKILKGNTRNEFAIIVEKKYLNKDDWSSVREVAGIRNNWNDSEKYLLISSTFEEGIPDTCISNLELDGPNDRYWQFQSNGIDFICSEFPITDAGGQNIGKVLSLIDIMDHINIEQKSNKTMMGLSAIMFIVTIFIGIFMSRSISKPIIKLKTATENIGKGNLDTKIDVDSRDELGQLAVAFKKMTEDLKKSTISRNYLNNIIENIYGSLIVTDNYGKISNINKKTCFLLEYKEEELIGHSIDIIFQSENESNEKSTFKEIIQKGFITNIEKNYITKNGAIIPMLFSSSIMSDETGNFTGIICVALELTERKKTEEKITKLNEDLQRQAVELTAINKELEAFSYSVSHDLRAPLRTIDGFSQAILEDYADKFDEEGKDYLRRVRAASQKMAQLIEDMLKLSRLTRSEMNLENVDMSAIVKSISDELRATQPERKVEFIIAQGITANADARLLRVALENLLRNAWKFTGNRTNTRIEFGVAQIDRENSYFITDNGAGFDMAYVNKLFGAFQRLHSSTEFPGTGIGLAIVQRIIHRHGGKVRAKGEIEKGATFYFTLGSVKKNEGRI